MPPKSKNTAILVFIRDPKTEVAEKVFAEHLGRKGNQKLVSILNKRIIKLCKSTAFDTFVSRGADQIGNTFGERFANAFESIFNQGYDQVIAVGNDCLAITEQTIYAANQAFEHNSLVVGPALDGGLYLIGMAKQAYHREHFLNFHWQTRKLGPDFIHYASKEGFAIRVFQTASDIDNATDFRNAIKTLPRLNKYRKMLGVALVRTVPKIFKAIFFHVQLFFLRNLSLRAPPF